MSSRSRSSSRPRTASSSSTSSSTKSATKKTIETSSSPSSSCSSSSLLCPYTTTKSLVHHFLSLTPIDRIIVLSFSLFLIIGLCVDYINAFAPIGGVIPATSQTWRWPPTSVWSMYWYWVKECDPLLLANPAWCWFVSLLSPVLYCPFYVLSIWCFIKKVEAIRIPLIIYASWLFLTLAIYFIEALWGDKPSPNMVMFSAGYGYYQVFPVVLVWRLWEDKPFRMYKDKKQ